MLATTLNSSVGRVRSKAIAASRVRAMKSQRTLPSRKFSNSELESGHKKLLKVKKEEAHQDDLQQKIKVGLQGFSVSLREIMLYKLLVRMHLW